MEIDMKIVEEAKKPLSMHPKKFALWLFMASVMMVFAALTSAYIVRQAEGNWMVFDLPSLFWVNTGIILLSSVTLHWGYISAKRDDLATVKLAVGITTILGVGFLVGQWFAWEQMVVANVYLVGDRPSAVSGSFVYVISGLHGLHIVSGIIFLLIVLAAAFRYEIHSKNLTRMEMCLTYWHFLDALWLYLFLFMLFNR
ncbi:MAG: cytochrome c oxidase subunit 3 [Bacteroidota bacterium]|jgi:cytochrome c oxidase subunit 3|nr:MAG: cytochrome oxidase subunit III [Bacteroidota bacterium]